MLNDEYLSINTVVRINPCCAEYFLYSTVLPIFYPANNLQHSNTCKHVFSSLVENSVNPDQMTLVSQSLRFILSLRLYSSFITSRPGPEVIKLFSCSTQLSTKFQLLVKIKMPTNEEVCCLSLSYVVFILLINAKMPTIVFILTFISRINFVLS